MLKGTKKYWALRYLFGTIGLIGLVGAGINYFQGEFSSKRNLPYLIMLGTGTYFGITIKSKHESDYGAHIYDLEKEYLRNSSRLNDFKIVSDRALNELKKGDKSSKVTLERKTFFDKEFSNKLKIEKLK